jgi:3-oxoacyl-[acyl-carrier-protein] synthase II
MAASRRVVLTGMGVLTPLGMDPTSFYSALVSGRSGIKPIQNFDPSLLATRFAGEIVGFDIKKHLRTKDERRQIRVMARSIQFAAAGADLALADGKVDKSKLDPTRFGVVFGAGLIPSELEELGVVSDLATGRNAHPVDVHKWGSSIDTIPPLWMLKYLPNMLACHVSILHNAQGPNNSITQSDVGSLLALGEATHIIQRNQSDFFLVGGCDSKINPLSMVRQMLFKHLSKCNETPAQAAKPFDRRRDGPVIGEGGCVLIAEELEHARRRGANIYGEVAGFAAGFDRGRTGKGIARIIRVALAEAGITPADVDHVNAHGLSSVPLDAWEARGIHEVFGTSVAVWAVKSYIGTLGAGSGTTELAASLLALKNGTLPSTLNYQEPDPACPVKVLREPRPVSKPYFVKIGQTDMGQCAAVVCRKWE